MIENRKRETSSVGRYQEIRERLQGPIFSIVTPFIPESEEIDYLSIEKYIDDAYAEGARVFYVMAYNSRYSELSWEEIKTLNAHVIQYVKAIDTENIIIVGDPLHCSTKVSVEFARHAESAGADIISLICREKFYSEEQIFQHYSTVASSCSIGILIHEMPFLSGYGGPSVMWPLTLLDRLADIENIIAVKEDAKDDDYSREVVEVLRDRMSIIISGGGLRQWLQFASLGCQAWLTGISVFEPKFELIFWRAYQEKNQALLDKIIDEIEVPFFKRGVKKFGWHLTIKAALERQGYMSRHERLPLLALKDEEAELVYQVVDQVKKVDLN